MDASRKNWIAEQHESDAIAESLDELTRVSLPHGGILALALPEDVSEATIREALGDSYEVISIEHAPETHDRFVIARRTVTKAKRTK